MTLQPGTRLGPYDITTALGAGGMGEVYKARDTRLGRDVAVKVLPEAFASDPVRLARFQQEARAAAALHHPNIAVIYDVGADDETHYIVQELVPGTSLRTLIDRQRTPPIDAWPTVAAGIADALVAAHAAGIIHRDIKPDNVIVADDGQAKVLDFGLAKVVRPDVNDASEVAETRMDPAGLTSAGTVMGTAAYMSPEQIRGEPVDERTDLWAFGCVLYEMLTGQRAFNRDTAPDSLAATLRDDPEWSALPIDLPPAVRALLRDCLRKARDERPRDAAAVRRALEEALRQPGTASASVGSAEVGPASGLPRQPAAKSRRLKATAAIGTALVAAVLGSVWWFTRAAIDAPVIDRSIAVLPFETLGAEAETSFTDGVHGDMLTRLSKVPGLRVISRTSVLQYRRPQQSLPEIAEQLGVAWVLLGEVQEAGDHVQVNARLVYAVEDRQVWAESYVRELTAAQLFEIQRELTEEIAGQLETRLDPGEGRRAARPPTDNLAAYRRYAEGRAVLDQRTAGAMRQALALFHEATQLDQNYALAWVGIADASVLLEAYGHAPRGSLQQQGFDAVDRALEIDPELAEAHASFGLLSGNAGRSEEARRALERALELRPSYADAYSWLSVGDALRGSPEAALANAERAVELNPLSVEAVGNLALAAMATGQFDRGLQEAQRMQTIEPTYATGRFYEGIARYHLGDLDGARPTFEGSSVPWTGFGPMSALAVIDARSGNQIRAREVLSELEQQEDFFGVGLIHAALGNHEAAFAAFDRSDDLTFWPVYSLRYFFPTLLEPLRQDPRWDTIRRRLDATFGIGG